MRPNHSSHPRESDSRPGEIAAGVVGMGLMGTSPLMASAYPQVVISQRTLFQLQVSYITALEKLWANAAALQNFTLSGGLGAPTPSGSSSTTVNLPGNGTGSIE